MQAGGPVKLSGLGLCVLLVAGLCAGRPSVVVGQPLENGKYGQQDMFRQLEEWWPTPNGYRTASGGPGPDYWQQQADYVIDVELDDEKQRINGRATITYHNRSPEELRYLWLQLDQNLFDCKALPHRSAAAPSFGEREPVQMLEQLLYLEHFPGGYTIERVADGQGNFLPHTVVETMMRVDLPKPLTPGESTQLEIAWSFAIVDADLVPARSGYEYFEADKNYIYEMAQWFPRLVAFTDNNGWQHKQFLGAGEFTLELGNYRVRITVPADHVVLATGTLQNPTEVLTAEQQQRLADARKADRPVFIVTPEEAKAREKQKSTDKKTWAFAADNVRDFAFASSRKFIWDAQGCRIGDRDVLAMSLYPNEGEPLWSKYSTPAIIHTLNVYGRYTFEYPYPVAISVNGPVGGMEYPMICFNGPRPQKDGTYSQYTKYGLISVVIHEVGHNFFPMIVNSDERQWTWMDEGLNTFLQYLAEQEWEQEYPSQRGEPADIVGYMTSTKQVPIMTNSESVIGLGPNAYAKPATALNILRETVLGRELFDFAFKEYARRWKFKRPQPADFFRTMEDASGTDLDWFWRGWFYSTDHVDLAVTDIDLYQIDNGDPDERAKRQRDAEAAKRPTLSDERNRELTMLVDRYPGLKDFYNSYDKLEVTDEDRQSFKKFLESLDEDQRKLIASKTNFYVIHFRNDGGLVSPIVFEVEYGDGSKELITIPAEIWRRDHREVAKLMITDQEIQSIQLDPRRQLADSDPSDNRFPPQIEPSRFKVFKQERTDKNPMQKANERAEAERKKREAGASPSPAAEATNDAVPAADPAAMPTETPTELQPVPEVPLPPSTPANPPAAEPTPQAPMPTPPTDPSGGVTAPATTSGR
jgi:hypothetical protein